MMVNIKIITDLTNNFKSCYHLGTRKGLIEKKTRVLDELPCYLSEHWQDYLV